MTCVTFSAFTSKENKNKIFATYFFFNSKFATPFMAAHAMESNLHTATRSVLDLYQNAPGFLMSHY